MRSAIPRTSTRPLRRRPELRDISSSSIVAMRSSKDSVSAGVTRLGGRTAGAETRRAGATDGFGFAATGVALRTTGRGVVVTRVVVVVSVTVVPGRGRGADTRGATRGAGA